MKASDLLSLSCGNWKMRKQQVCLSCCITLRGITSPRTALSLLFCGKYQLHVLYTDCIHKFPECSVSCEIFFLDLMQVGENSHAVLFTTQDICKKYNIDTAGYEKFTDPKKAKVCASVFTKPLLPKICLLFYIFISISFGKSMDTIGVFT